MIAVDTVRVTTIADPAVSAVLDAHCDAQFAAFPSELRESLVSQQRAARLGAFAAAHPAAQAWIAGDAAGYAIVDLSGGDGIRLVDLIVHPAHRGGGMARMLLREVTAEADAAGRAVDLTVEPGSVAEAMYLRRGFCGAPAVGAHRALRREPIENGAER
ncbi:GNAT family N-acetyltransferase [Microbacterium fluvii]|uniref:GNAT family N-acetyltransferase n=1 Tax=Microbacterium fluvii TaxID=415215 RepID=A0ABW2HDB4_9MICO|nr:GNAT family N-acetyltransferase [Microbacterium fluvii]MCU4672849.1 GNAT family N-acetyltransferase [Microbacterium fluvii]